MPAFPQQRVVVVDLCAGIGVFSYALRRTTGEALWHIVSEIDDAAIEVFLPHFPHADFVGDVEKTSSELPKKCILRHQPERRRRHWCRLPVLG